MNSMKPRSALRLILAVALAASVSLSCMRQGPDDTPTLRLATTPHVDSSGVLAEILPDFEERHDAVVEIAVVGVDEALALGKQGSIDVMLLHAPQRQDRFIEQGFGTLHRPVMYDDLVIVGPETDPAGIAEATSATEAFARIAASRSAFISRGDQSETHARELAIWQEAGTALDPLTGWYQSLGQGMSDTLAVTNGERGYTLTNRASYISMRDDLSDLVILFGGASADQNPDPVLRTVYSVIQVNPDRHPDVSADIAEAFVEWITSPDVQASVGEFGLEQFGQPVFMPVEAP